MRVVHLCNLSLPADHPDAGRLATHPGRWVLNLALAQRSYAAIKPLLVVQVPGAADNHEAEIEGIPVRFIAAPSRFRALTLFHFDARRLARAVLACEPDVVHAHGTEDAYLLAAQATGRPYIVTAQGLYSQINSVMPPKPFSRAWVIERIERHSLSKARHIVAKSEYVADWLSETYPHAAIHRIPNTFDPRILQIRAQGRAPGSIAFVGSIDERKGLHLLADAVERANGGLLKQTTDSAASGPDAHRRSPPAARGALHIFGNRDEGASAYESRVIGRLRAQLGVRLILHGVVPSDELFRRLAGVELLVAPSLEEMFGNQVIEALLLGTWPIVSSRTAMEENVRRVGAGTVFKNNDAASLAAAIPEAFAAQAAWNRAATRDAVNAWMGQAPVARAHSDLYQRILEEWTRRQ